MPDPEATTTPDRSLDVQALTSAHGGPFSLTLGRGVCVAVVGRSGSGKSVLLRLIADLDPHEGEVRLDGRLRSSWTAPEWRRRVVYQAAEPAWWAPTGDDHFRPGERAAVLAMLPALGLDVAQLGTEIGRLSTGERQRLALIRSLAGGPRVVLLDEPTASLDAVSTLAVETLLAERVAAGLSVLFVTHSPEQAGRVGHRRLEVRDHRIQPP